jgi:hypothetical protein
MVDCTTRFNPAKLGIRFVLLALTFLSWNARAQLWISEILFNPPGSDDAPHEYIELRGTPNLLIPAGTYFVGVEGDANGNPGTIQNVFDLSGRTVSGNSFLVLLQKTNSYVVNSNATLLVNTNGPGFGSGGSSSIGHRGENGDTEIENGSATFFLIQSTNYPTVGADIDSGNNGVPNGSLFASWKVLDSVGVLDSDGPGDIAYGLINFHRGNGGTALTGTPVTINFTPSYIARTGNTTTWTAAEWVASGNLGGTAPNWLLSANEIAPLSYRTQALNHIGSPNFNAPRIAGVIVRQSDGSTDVSESGGTDSYTLALNTAPAGAVTIRISAAQLEVSTNGTSFSSQVSIVLNSTNARTIFVRAVDDAVVDTWPHIARIQHTITSTSDATQYPTSTLIAPVNVNVAENDFVLLNELKVNPPGTNDAPNEFVELRGAPNALLTNVYLLAINGDKESNPGTATLVVSLSGERLGSGGLLLLVASGHPYSVPIGTRVLLVPQFSNHGGGLGNGTLTLLLASSPVPIVEGKDLDDGDNGVLEDLPPGTTVLDSVAWKDGESDDQVYSGVTLDQNSGVPDAATRYPGINTPNSSSAWFNGDLTGSNGETLLFDEQNVSANFPFGVTLTPGAANNTPPIIAAIAPYSSVIGDATSPPVGFTVSSEDTPVSGITVTATSSDQAVVPDGNLLVSGAGGFRTLTINPIGVGYATITLRASDGILTGRRSFQYAASADLRGGGRFHTGVSDASTAIPIDARWMFVADDENQLIRIFSRSNSGPELTNFNMNPFLGLLDLYPDGRPKEVDTEGSTRVGNRIYWIGSHSHAQDAETRTNRGRIFTTDASGSGASSVLTFVGRYDYLKFDLLSWDANNAHGKGANYYGLFTSGAAGVDPKAEDGSGFNIEGLAMAPGSTNTAYVCFRAPLIPPTNRAKALIVPVTNFAALAISGGDSGSARFGEPIELNLGGRGIRSIEGNSNGYLIVAGPPGVASGIPPSDFRLFTWKGYATNAPQERSTDLREMIPEGIIELPSAPWTSNTMVQLLSDNGITVYYNDGVQAKLLEIPEFKKFRTDWVTLGLVVTPRPVIKSIQHADGNCVLTWYSVAGVTYRVQSKLTVDDASWVDVPGDVVASDALASKTLPIGVPSQRFFRIVIVP